MKTSNTKGKTTNTKGKKTFPKNTITDLVLYCFEQDCFETRSGDMLTFRCKMQSKPVDGEEFGDGVNVEVVAPLWGDTPAMVEDGEYDKKWIIVSGNLSAYDWVSKDKKKHGTTMKVWATTVKLA